MFILICFLVLGLFFVWMTLLWLCYFGTTATAAAVEFCYFRAVAILADAFLMYLSGTPSPSSILALYDVLTVCFEAPPHKCPYKHIPRLLCVMALANKTIQNEPHTLKMVIFVCTTVAVSLCDRANFTLILTRNGVENYSMTNDAIGGLWFSFIA